MPFVMHLHMLFVSHLMRQVHINMPPQVRHHSADKHPDNPLLLWCHHRSFRYNLMYPDI